LKIPKSIDKSRHDLHVSIYFFDAERIGCLLASSQMLRTADVAGLPDFYSVFFAIF
jgi:hypothetical protein